MIERRKTRDRRNKLPKESLPLYYTRRVPDRRQDQDPLQQDDAAGAGGDNPASRFDVGDRPDTG